jgi:hypothetical protein
LPWLHAVLLTWAHNASQWLRRFRRTKLDELWSLSPSQSRATKEWKSNRLTIKCTLKTTPLSSPIRGWLLLPQLCARGAWPETQGMMDRIGTMQPLHTDRSSLPCPADGLRPMPERTKLWVARCPVIGKGNDGKRKGSLFLGFRSIIQHFSSPFPTGHGSPLRCPSTMVDLLRLGPGTDGYPFFLRYSFRNACKSAMHGSRAWHQG